MSSTQAYDVQARCTEVCLSLNETNITFAPINNGTDMEIKQSLDKKIDAMSLTVCKLIFNLSFSLTILNLNTKTRLPSLFFCICIRQQLF